MAVVSPSFKQTFCLNLENYSKKVYIHVKCLILENTLNAHVLIVLLI